VRKRLSRRDVEGRVKRLPLRFRNLLDKIGNGREKCVEAREGDLRLCLDARGLQHGESLSLFESVGEKRCLASPGRSTDDERSATAAACIGEKRVDSGTFDRTPV
jgi:hypothetical protein